MDFDSSSKFISSLAKFLQSLCNGYVEFDNGVEVIGHIYLSVDTGKKIDYILNEKVCKTNENSVTFISNSFHAQPAEKPKPTPKPSKAADQDKPSDPGGSQEDEILILDDQESKPSDTSFDNVSNQNSTSKSVPPHSASKRSYHQSFSQKNRPVPAKHSRPNPPSIHNPNGAHEADSLHSDPSNSSSNFLSSQALPTDSGIATTSEADMSRLPQVFPQTSIDSTNNSSVQAIKQEPGGDYSANVKQELDTSAQADEDQGMYDDQDQSGYGGMYGDEYYGSGRGDPSQRHVDYGMSGAGQSEFYPGGSGEGAGGDSSDAWRYKYQCEICQKRLRSAWELRDHKNSVHFKVLAFPCSYCGKRFAYKRSLKRHVETTCGKPDFSSQLTAPTSGSGTF